MKRCICFAIVFTALFFPLFSSSYGVGDSVSFDLVINKEGTSRLYFSLSASGEEGENNIKPFVEDNTQDVSEVFYVGYDIYSDVLNLNTDKIQILLTFTASGDPKVDSDFMLQNIENSDNGIVFDYTVSDTNASSGGASVGSSNIATIKFLENERDSRKKLLTIEEVKGRQVVLYKPDEGGFSQSPIHGFHKVSITINPPTRINEEGSEIEGFVTGQYRGYAVLSIEAIG